MNFFSEGLVSSLGLGIELAQLVWRPAGYSTALYQIYFYPCQPQTNWPYVAQAGTYDVIHPAISRHHCLFEQTKNTIHHTKEKIGPSHCVLKPDTLVLCRYLAYTTLQPPQSSICGTQELGPPSP
jgi:hypothetical protein